MLNAAIIGYGNIGPTHARALEKAENARIYIICDNQFERAERGALEHGCRAERDFDAVLKDKAVDVVHICTPHYLHKDMAVAALAAGKHVVLEKPLAMNHEELAELVEAEKASDKQICIMFQNRTNNAACVLKNMVDQKIYGEIKAVSAFATWERDEAYYKADAWRGKWATEGGGVLINQAVHLLDLMCYIGGKPVSVKASISNKHLESVIEVEDTVDALITYEGGYRGCFYASNAYGVTTPQQLVVEFENGRLRYSDNFLFEFIGDGEPKVLAGNNKETPGKSCWGAGHITVIASYYNFLENGGKNPSPLSGGIVTSKLLYSIYESGKADGKEVLI